MLPTIAAQTGLSIYALLLAVSFIDIHRKSKYMCTAYPTLCALIELSLLTPLSKGQSAALLTILSVLFSPHRLCSYTKELLTYILRFFL